MVLFGLLILVLPFRFYPLTDSYSLACTTLRDALIIPHSTITQNLNKEITDNSWGVFSFLNLAHSLSESVSSME